MMRLRHGQILGLVLLAILVTAACSKSEAQSSAAGGGGRGGGAGRGGAQAGPAVPVTTAKVIKKDVPREVIAIGTAEASQIVSIRAQITGTLTSVNFKEGDDVTKGQVLFTTDRRPLEAALRQAQANLARDTAQAANAKASSDRYQDLLSRGIATKEEADQSLTSAAALEATVQADRAAIENARVQLQYSTISAEISGRTGQLMVNLGNLVRANDATPLVVINQISPINVSFGIPEGQFLELKRYLAQGPVPVEARAPDETVASRGTITFTDNAVDVTTGTIKIKGSFPNTDRRLWPGQFVNVVVTLTTDPGAIVVPSAAVQSGQQGSYVFVVKADRTVDLRPVVVNRTSGNDTLVKDGLKPGETVVSDGQLRLVPGSRVVVRTEKAAS